MPVVWAVEVLVREERSVQVSEKFTASNGVDITITPEGIDTFLLGKGGIIRGGDRRWTVATGNKDGIDALREFFQHERDQGLGRWRSKEFPEYVVYSKEASEVAPEPGVRVVHEGSGRSRDIGREVVGACDATVSRFGQAAQAYFDAHPLPKPWHDAKPGEVWVIKLENGTECAATREYGLDFKLSYGNLMQPRDERIIAGRRIWPEAVGS